MVVVPRDRVWLALAIAGAVLSGVATSPGPGPAAAKAEPACALHGFVPARQVSNRAGWRACDQLEQGCFQTDHPGYYELRDWLAPHPIGFQFRSEADLDGDGRTDCFTATLTPVGWTVEARLRGELTCSRPAFASPAVYVMSRHLHAAAGPTARP